MWIDQNHKSTDRYVAASIITHVCIMYWNGTEYHAYCNRHQIHTVQAYLASTASILIHATNTAKKAKKAKGGHGVEKGYYHCSTVTQLREIRPLKFSSSPVIAASYDITFPYMLCAPYPASTASQGRVHLHGAVCTHIMKIEHVDSRRMYQGP